MRKLTVLTAAILLLLLTTIPAWAKDPATPQMTLQQAYDTALTHSDDLKNDQSSYKKAGEVRDNAFLGIEYSVAPSTANGTQDSKAVAADNAYASADLGYRTAIRDIEETKKQLKVDVYSAYTGILMAEESLRNSNQQLEQALSALKVARVQKEVGMLSGPALTKAQADYDKALKTRDADAESVSKAYVTFNKLVGLWPEDRPVLTDKIEYSPVQVDNIDTEVSRALESSQSIWKLQQDIGTQKRDLKNVSKPYDEEKYDVDMANNSVDAAKKALDESIRQAYSDIMSLEAKYDAAQSSLKTAEDNLRVTKVQYDIGMSTKNDLTTAEATLSTAKNGIFSIACQHENSKVAFYKSTGRENVFPGNK